MKLSTSLLKDTSALEPGILLSEAIGQQCLTHNQITLVALHIF